MIRSVDGEVLTLRPESRALQKSKQPCGLEKEEAQEAELEAELNKTVTDVEPTAEAPA